MKAGVDRGLQVQQSHAYLAWSLGSPSQGSSLHTSEWRLIDLVRAKPCEAHAPGSAEGASTPERFIVALATQWPMRSEVDTTGRLSFAKRRR